MVVWQATSHDISIMEFPNLKEAMERYKEVVAIMASNPRRYGDEKVWLTVTASEYP